MSELVQYKKEQHRVFGEFLHEIKTPLSIMRTHLESEINNERIPLDVRQKLVLDVEEIARINYLVNDMKMLFDSNIKEEQASFKEDSLLELVMDVIETLEPLASAKNQKISLLSTQNCSLNMNKNKLKQLFFNLINNAIKYSDESCEICVEFKQDTMIKNSIKVLITDKGIGIKQEELEDIFTPFYRVKGLKEEGVGLGLALCKVIATMHNATLSVQSVLGEGSVFMVEFHD